MQKSTIEDQKNMEMIYESMFVENDSSGVLGPVAMVDGSGGSLVGQNVDGYATGNNKIPVLLGKVQTRSGPIKKKLKKTNSKKKTKKSNKVGTETAL